MMDKANEFPREQLPLALGTAQLGMEYGIANRSGKPNSDKALGIVMTALDHGIRLFDTAQAYGNSEEVLGCCLKKARYEPKTIQPMVISKLKPDTDPSDIHGTLAEVNHSLQKLGLKRLWGLMLHRETLLDRRGDDIRRLALRLKESRRTERFGISVYSPEKAIEALDMKEIDLVQLPFNVFDQRALERNVFNRAAELGKIVFIRSIFLQGLLLMDPHDVPKDLPNLKNAIIRYVKFAKETGIPRKLLAMSFVVQNAPEALIIFGAEREEQVNENVELFHQTMTLELPKLGNLSSKDPELINPAKWFH